MQKTLETEIHYRNYQELNSNLLNDRLSTWGLNYTMIYL